MANADDPKDQNQNQTGSDNATNKAYGQYIDPEYHNKQKKKKLLIITASILAALIVIAAVAAITVNSSNQSNSAEEPATAVEVCTDEECFNERFSLCQPAKYEASEENSTVEYEVTGIREIGCLVSLKYVSSEDEEIVGKGMTCDFDNELEFHDSAHLVFAYHEDYECEGELTENLQ